jgi:hypothetical protein
MLGFPAAILALCALRERILGARKSPSDEPRPSTGGSTIAEWELQRRVYELANEEELRAEFSSEELAKITGLVDDSLAEVGEALRDGRIGVLLNRWWKEDKIKRGLVSGRPLEGKESLEGFDVVEDSDGTAMKRKAEYEGRPLPRWTKGKIGDMVAREVGLSGDRALRRLISKRPAGRIDPGSIDPRLKKRRPPPDRNDR